MRSVIALLVFLLIAVAFVVLGSTPAVRDKTEVELAEGQSDAPDADPSAERSGDSGRVSASEPASRPAIAASTGSRNSREGPREDEPEAVSDLDLDLVDEAGVTGRQRLGYLQNAREHFRALELEDSVDARILRAAQQNLASRCVVSILHANGRAQFQFDPEESARGGFRLNGDTPDELVIAADLAKYTFWKGEFPAYDQARALASGRENIVPSDHRESLEGLYLEALRSFGMDSESTVTLKR